MKPVILKSALALTFLGGAPALFSPQNVPAPFAPLSAQTAHAQNAIIGVVDGVKINDSFTKLKDALALIEKRKQGLRDQLDARVFMAETDTKRFDELIVKPAPNEAENTELTKLVTGGTSRRSEYNTLIAKAAKTAEDTARIKTIEDETQRTATTFQAILERVDQAVTKQEVDTEEQYRTQIIKIVEAVANEKKLVVVVGKQAVAWNSATVEITDEVITRLNRA